MDEVIGLVKFIVAAGNATTRSLLSSIALKLVEYPELVGQIKTGASEFLDRVIEETLRVESPVMVSPRIATRDREL
jgi:cytochrome P450